VSRHISPPAARSAWLIAAIASVLLVSACGSAPSASQANPGEARTAANVGGQATPLSDSVPAVGSIFVSPATIECASPVDVWFTAHLPNSVRSGDTVNMTFEVNGQALNDYPTPWQSLRTPLRRSQTRTAHAS